MFRYLFLLISLLLSLSSYAAIDVKTYIPSQALQYLPTVKAESNRLLPDFEYDYYFAGLIEHESCIHLQHKRCWSPTSRLKTSREEGAGLSQMTRTFKSDGSIRFDVLSDLRRAHMQELKELSWSNIYQRPDLQIRSMILLSRSNYKALYTVKDSYERLAMTDCSYNAGYGSIKKDRQYCGLKKDCDPNKWFGHVEINSLKSRKPIYGQRSAFDISRNHVHDTLTIRMPKYKPYF